MVCALERVDYAHTILKISSSSTYLDKMDTAKVTSVVKELNDANAANNSDVSLNLCRWRHSLRPGFGPDIEQVENRDRTYRGGLTGQSVLRGASYLVP